MIALINSLCGSFIIADFFLILGVFGKPESDLEASCALLLTHILNQLGFVYIITKINIIDWASQVFDDL